MRIAFLIGSFPNLTETFILNQITGLLDRKHEVDIYALTKGDCPKIQPEIQEYNLLKKVNYLSDFKMPNNKLVRIFKAIRLIFVFLFNKPLTILKALNFFKYGKKAFSLELLYNVFIFMGKGPYDVIQCHFGSMGNLGVLLRELGAIEGKIVTTFHGSDMSYYLRKHNSNIYDHLLEKGDLFLPVSEKWKEKLIKMGCDERKIVVHRMGVDLSKFLFSPHRKSKNIKLLSIGRFIEKKGIEYGIRAVAKTLKKYSNVEYNIIGDGPLKSRFEDLIKEFEVRRKIKLLGWKTQLGIRKLMKESDIMIAPSVTSSNGDQEGIPVILIESLATGLPVVTTWHSGIPELVQDKKSGFLVPEKDVERLADRIKYLIEHPEIRSVLALSGRKYVEAHYDIEKLNDRLVKRYEGLTTKVH